MTPGAHYTAVAEILDTVMGSTRDLKAILRAWGRDNRYAGSKDRRAISNLAFDILRKWPEWGGRGFTGRQIVLLHMKATGQDIDAMCNAKHGLGELSEDEIELLRTGPMAHKRDQAVHSQLSKAFGKSMIQELVGLFSRAPVDIRANALKTSRDELLEKLAEYNLEPTPHSPWGVRGKSGLDLSQTPEFNDGLFDIQDEGSQIAAMLSGVQPGETVIDLCAGGGGKTLALAAMLQGQGTLLATDIHEKRLNAIKPRLDRAGASAELLHISPDANELSEYHDLADCVLVDAPCTGSGVWRRHPEDAWRLNQGIIDTRAAEQRQVLDNAAKLVKPGGRLVYVTCSVLPAENTWQIEEFLQRHADFTPADMTDLCPDDLHTHFGSTPHMLQLTPKRTNTDAFFIANLQRSA